MLTYQEMSAEELDNHLVEIFQSAIRNAYPLYSEKDIAHYEKDLRFTLQHAFTLYGMDENDQIVGFLSIIGIYIRMLYVHPDHTGQGIGTSLLQEATDIHHVSLSCVNEHDERTIKFLEKRGFVIDNNTGKDPHEPYPLTMMCLKEPKQQFIKIAAKTKRYNKLLKMGDCSLEENQDYLDSCDIYGLEKEGQAIGVAVVNHCGRIMNFALLPKFRKQYYGAFMLNYLILYYNDKFRWLRIATSGNNVPFFKKHNFQLENKIQDYYRDKYPNSRRYHRKRYDPWDLVTMKLRIGK